MGRRYETPWITYFKSDALYIHIGKNEKFKFYNKDSLYIAVWLKVQYLNLYVLVHQVLKVFIKNLFLCLLYKQIFILYSVTVSIRQTYKNSEIV